MRVLLADDHSIVRRGLRGLLEAAGLTVVGEASDGLEAARLCEEQRPDIVILDIGMPKLSGIEVAARAQKLERPPGVIILSVHGDESYIMRALAAGARAYLLKSATDEDLILMRRHTPAHVQVKAAGGVRDLDRLLRVREIGCTRSGATATKEILDEARRRLAVGVRS